MSGRERLASQAYVDVSQFRMSNLAVGTIAILLGCVTTAAVASAIGIVYQYLAYGNVGRPGLQAAFGAAAGLFYAVPFLVRGEYTIPAYLASGRRPQRIFMSWNAAFLAILTLLFLTQTSTDMSRVIVATFYIAGLMAMIALESGVRTSVIYGLREGILPPRRVMLIGTPAATAALADRMRSTGSETERIGVRVVALAPLPLNEMSHPGEGMTAALEQAVVKARALLPDEVLIAARLDDHSVVERVVTAFEQLPVAIHLDAGEIVSRFNDVALRRVGSAATLSIAELPLSPFQTLGKRAFDVAGSLVCILFAAPFMALIALAIRLDTGGPVLFKQDRTGFNRRHFTIYKFRSMTSADNGSVVEQAKKNDPRITRVGAFLRRTNLDELPQLFNVLKGDMSLVGPRPHAVAHDEDYEQRILGYPRRLNMKPGITGWAQVNGLRGETDTVDKMRRRVEADIYYIENWSLMFDLYIMLLTVASPKTFRNAR